VGLRRTSLSHPHLYRPHWVLQRVGLAGTILSFFSSESASLLQFQFVLSNSHSFPSASNNGRVVNETGTLLIGISRPPKLPTVTTDLGTKLGTRLSNGVAIHHCRDGLLPLLVAIPSSPIPTICSFPPWPDSAGTRFRGLLKLHSRYGLQDRLPA